MIANTNKKKEEYVYDIYSEYITGWSSDDKAMHESRKLLLEYWVREKDYKRNHNIFQRTWRSIKDRIKYW